jgi:histidinol-phosphate aminotransferase
MSKGFGLAALRVGYGIADPWLVDVLHRMRIPFSLNLVGLWAGLAAVQDPAYIELRQQHISSECQRLFASLQEIPGVVPFPSDGNFILIDISATGLTATEIVDLVHEEEILIRAMTAHHLRERHVRVTIGTIEQNDRFLTVFRSVLRRQASQEGSPVR